MKKLILVIAMGASALTAIPAAAQNRGDYSSDYNREVRQDRRDYGEAKRE